MSSLPQQNIDNLRVRQKDLIWNLISRLDQPVLFRKNSIIMKWRIGFFAYCALVLYFSSLSPKEFPEQALSFPDHAIHFMEYALMGILGWGAFGRGSSGFPWALFAFCCCFGIADECWQDWLDRSRVADVWDVASDAAGAFAGLLLSMVFWKR